MDYNSLKLQIQNFTNRTDQFFIDQIPDFINQGINRIYSEAKSIGFQKILENVHFDAQEPLIAKPIDWRRTISLSYYIQSTPLEQRFLLPRSYEFCATYSPNTVMGDPIFYADYNLPTITSGPGLIYLSPTPEVAYQYELVYLGTPLFNEANPKNFLTDRYPNLLLYACLVEVMPFLKDDERIATIEASYNRSLKDALEDNAKSYTDRLSKRDN